MPLVPGPVAAALRALHQSQVTHGGVLHLTHAHVQREQWADAAL